MRTIVGVFTSLADAERTERDLKNLGIPHENISIVAGNDANRHEEYLGRAKVASIGTGAAAAAGASFGGGVGLIAGLVVLVIPGVGPILAGGALVTLLTGLGIGAAGGGLIAAFVDMGIPHEEAPIYEEAVRRGAVMLAVNVDSARENDALGVMVDHGARNLRDEIDTWKAAGWSGPSVDPHPSVGVSTIRSHEIPGEEEHVR
jgi:uncharacterized membrane protein